MKDINKQKKLRHRKTEYDTTHAVINKKNNKLKETEITQENKKKP